MGGGSGKIAYVSGEGDDAEIYVMNVDGSHQTRMTQNDKRDFDPVWSPDGKMIAFSTEYFGNYKIFVMNADGSDLKCLTDEFGSEMGPVWSPDGTKIAYTDGLGGFVEWKAAKNDQLEVFVMNPDGSNKRNLTQNKSSDYDPAWSQDGSKIAFVSDRYGSADIYMMDADGGNPVNVTKSGGDDFNPSWSPDGTQIAYNPGIQFINLDGSRWYRAKDGVYKYKKDSTGWGNDEFDFRYASFGANWSPDGKEILSEGLFYTREWGICPQEDSITRTVYKWIIPCSYLKDDKTWLWLPEVGYVQKWGNLAHGIFIIDSNGSEEINLTKEGYGEYDPSWSPDGKLIVFVGRAGEIGRVQNKPYAYFAVKIMDKNGSVRTTLTGPGASDPSWSP